MQIKSFFDNTFAQLDNALSIRTKNRNRKKCTNFITVISIVKNISNSKFNSLFCYNFHSNRISLLFFIFNKYDLNVKLFKTHALKLIKLYPIIEIKDLFYFILSQNCSAVGRVADGF